LKKKSESKIYQATVSLRRYSAQSDSEQVKNVLIQPKASKTWGYKCVSFFVIGIETHSLKNH